MNTIPLFAVVLAAGKGTRLHSDSPKVLRELLDEPMLHYVYQALEPVAGEHVYTVVGFGRDQVSKAFPERAERFVLQEEQLGTGHALQVAWEALRDKGCGWVLVANGDTPLLRPDHLRKLAECRGRGSALAFLTLTPQSPGALGRVIRHADGGVRAIIEAKDYDESRHGEAGEVNAGIYLLDMTRIAPLLGELKNENKSGEYYITDLVGLAVEKGLPVDAICCGDDPGLLGVNTAGELCEAEEALRRLIVEHWIESGVVIRQASSVRIGPMAEIAPGVEICGPAEVYGKSVLGRGVRVDSHVVIRDSMLTECRVRNFSHVEGATMEPSAEAGPYSRLRTGAMLRRGSKAGNFVEMKKAELGEFAKASHLTYLGDARVGSGTNIGAGTITCNYDGVNKHVTTIGERAFIGSNTALVAPVSVGAGSLVAAGSTITEDVPAGCKAFGRARQKNIKQDHDPS